MQVHPGMLMKTLEGYGIRDTQERELDRGSDIVAREKGRRSYADVSEKYDT
jgi:hypothetical protein